MTTMNAWLLLRRSSDKQEKSIPEQRLILETYASAQNFKIEDTFLMGKDKKEYAPTWLVESDPEFKRLLRRADERPQGGRILLIHDVSRSGRLDPNRKIYYEEYLRMRGVQIRYVTENFRNDGSMEDGLIQYLAHFRAKDTKERLSKDTFRGMTGLARMGMFCGGRPPYGFARMLLDRNGNPMRVLHFGERKSEKAEHVTLVLNPDSQIVETAKWIFASFDQGMHIISIVNTLNAKRIPAPKGGIWTKRTLREILANEVYIGNHRWNKRKYTRHEGKALVTFNDEQHQVRFQNAYPAIIDKDLFDRVQERIKLLKKRRNSTTHHYRSPADYPLTGGTCIHCGKRFGGQTHVRKKKDKVFRTAYYECMGSISGGVAACPNLIIPKQWLQEEVLKGIRQILPLYESRLLEIVNAMARGDVDNTQDVHRYERRIREIESGISRVMVAIETGLNSEEAVKRVNELRDEKNDLIDQVQRIRATPVQSRTQSLEQIRDRIRNFDTLIAAATPEERRAIFWTFLDHWKGNPDTREVDVVFSSADDLAKDFLSSTAIHYPRGQSAETVTEQAPATNLEVSNLRREMSGLQPTERWVLCFMGSASLYRAITGSNPS